MQKKKGITIFSVLSLSLISILITVILIHPFPYSRNSNNNNVPHAAPFLTYQDRIYGIKIQYPFNWEKIQFGKNFIVGFVSTSRHDSGVLENVMISSIKLSSSDTSLNNFGNTRISALELQYRDFHLVSSGPFITSTGSPLYKILECLLTK